MLFTKNVYFNPIATLWPYLLFESPCLSQIDPADLAWVFSREGSMKTARAGAVDWVMLWLAILLLCVAAGHAPVQGNGAAVGEAPGDLSSNQPAGSIRSSSGNAVTSSALFVPVILTASGRNHSFFTSELTLTNRGDREARLGYTYTAHAGGGSGTATEVLAPGEQKTQPDALEYLRRLGIPIPHSGNRIGTLRVEVSGSSEVGVSVRTTTSVPEGRAGLAYPGIAAADGFEEAVYLCGLRQNEKDRSNLAFQNMGAPGQGTVTLRTMVYSGKPENRSPHVLPDVALGPGGFHQYNAILDRAGFDNGYVRVERVSGTAPFYAYGVINDQANSDGSFVFPVAASSLMGTRGQTLPVIVDTGVYTSELMVTNFSDVAKTVTFRFRPEAVRTPDKTSLIERTFHPGHQVIVPNIVEVMRQMGTPGIGASGQTFAGALFATVAEGDMSGIAIGARTGSSDGRDGQYGVFYNAVPYGRAFLESAWVQALQQDEENRSNLALVNTGEVDDSPSVFRLDIYDGEAGALANTVAGLTVAAKGWHQINGILGNYAPETTQGYVRITRISGNNPFLAYGVINDGGAPGQRSGDGAYLPASGPRERTQDPGTEPPGAEPMTDREVLEVLYKATGGPNWRNRTNWLSDLPLSEWFGVETDNDGRVVRLDMAYYDQEWIDNNLSGPIPPELGELTGLESLQFRSNNLTGPIPAELGKLSNLESLDLGENDLSGPIPSELGRLSNLRGLYLHDNALEGPILEELGRLADLRGLYLHGNALEGPIPSELGNLSNLEWLALSWNDLSGPIPSELGRLANLRELYLQGNALEGPIPSELGNLSDLEILYIYRNNLTGLIPRSFLALRSLARLNVLHNAGLCAPGTSAFVGWLRGIDESEADLCNAADIAALRALFESAGGSSWTESAGWLGDGAVETWHGVTADSLGRVVAIDLTGNGLRGRLPYSLVELTRLTELRLADNPGLSGRLPSGLTRLTLRTLDFSGTGLCAPAEAFFRDWLAAIRSHEGTDAECAPLSDREILEILYDATGGPAWVNDRNWLSDAPLGEWYGVEVGEQGAVSTLRLRFNGLQGPIPGELGGLADLEYLNLYSNGLTGPVPSQLGHLANLRRFYLGRNRLTGRIPSTLGGLGNLTYLGINENDLSGLIPPELGGLANLYDLDLRGNRLSGSVPAALGKLSSLRSLRLGRNALSGSIPAALGNLDRLSEVNLSGNRLSGSIPPELGGLDRLEELYLGFNELTGSAPPELGGLTNLRRLALQSNAGMSGVLPAGLTNLAHLDTLQTTGTDLCAPSDAGFLEWLEGVPNRRVVVCDSDGRPAVAYLVQTVQSASFPVPLVAGKPALLRVFPTAARENAERLPRVRASFHLGEELVHVADIEGKPGPIPTGMDEGSLARSANALIPAGVIRPGLEMVIAIDPAGTLYPGLGVAKRFPDTGRLAVDVRDMPVLDLTLVPFLWTEEPDSKVVDVVAEMASDPEGHELLGLLRARLPVGELRVTAHEPVLSSSNNAFDLFAETRAIRTMEGGTGYFMGMLSGSFTGPGGIAGIEASISFSVPDAQTIAHEFGHNFSLPHAPCGGAGSPDPAYPTSDGTIAVWGYDFESGRMAPPTSFDVMGYCEGVWFSDYYFTKALNFRLEHEAELLGTGDAPPARSLLLWGGVDGDRNPFLEPAFVVQAPASLPRSTGEHQIIGRTAAGGELFSLSFDMPVVADGDGGSSFAFVLPVQPGWADQLASITLSGHGGSVTLDQDTDRPVTILRNARTRQIRAILRDAQVTPRNLDATVSAQSVETGLERLTSRGIPSPNDWAQ